MTYYLISDREVVYDAVTQASSSLVLTPNFTNFVDPNPHVGSDSYTNINGTVFANFATNPLQVSQTYFQLTVDQWNTYFSAQTFISTGSYEQVVECALKYIKENVQPMFGLTSANWILVESTGSTL